MNTFGNLFRLTSFGESHGKTIGGVIDGCPSNIDFDIDFIQDELNRRKPGQSKISTKRKEDDKLEIVSGVFNRKTLGTPIAFLIWNNDAKSSDYEENKNIFRPSHADYTYQQKYGIRDYRGGGRASARTSISTVVAGAVAKLILNKIGVQIFAYVSQIGNIELNKNYNDLNLSNIESNIVRCPDKEIAAKMISQIEEVEKSGDSLGGIITCVVKDFPKGIGEPVFNKLNAELGKAILSINAVKGFEFGSGFESSQMKGSEHNDLFYFVDNKVRTRTNNSGGIQGGISNGEDIYFRVAFKPTPTIFVKQETIDVDNNRAIIENKGRHDPCFVPRAVPVVEAMTAMVLADYYLISKCYL
ncbi:MAG: chorismate synthase [Bacteroidetes bacterium]|nr:MAG: chorismate synthase [Bacteroidota bacterium]